MESNLARECASRRASRIATPVEYAYAKMEVVGTIIIAVSTPCTPQLAVNCISTISWCQGQMTLRGAIRTTQHKGTNVAAPPRSRDTTRTRKYTGQVTSSSGNLITTNLLEYKYTLITQIVS